MKKVLVTGSCGFIFGNFIRKAIYDQNQKKPQDRLYTFTSIDKMAAVNNSMYWNKNHTFYLADITDAHIIDRIFQFEKPDIVIHGAAETFVDTSLKDANSFVNSNVLGTQVIINSCLKYKTERLIYISTDEVYGQLTNEQEVAWTEESPLAPRNPYAATKAAGELLVKAAHTTHGLIYNITRSSNCYGPRQLPEKLVPKAIKCVLDGQKIPIYGQGLQIRDWTYVADNCTAIMTVLDKGEPNEIYNISANQEFTNIETIQQVCNALGKGWELITHIPDPRPGHDFRYSIDTTKIKNLGWKPSCKFKEGIKDTVQWYTDNQWFLR
jgi:dTDP-glucose 4,6-dehydratase